MTRVDKSDILELTVYHLTQLQQQQRSITMATDAAAYDTGYKECARDTMNYLSTSRVTSESTINLLNNHLHGTFVMKSRNRYLSSSSFQPFGENLSTPIRPSDVNNSYTSSSSELSSSFGCSPILLSANENSYSDSTGSPTPVVGGESSGDLSISTSTDVFSSSVVTIGDGSENEIGHVIKQQTWRPWWLWIV